MAVDVDPKLQVMLIIWEDFELIPELKMAPQPYIGLCTQGAATRIREMRLGMQESNHAGAF